MTTWILLRGLTRETRHWGSFPRELAAEFPGDRVLPLELPGNGELNNLASPWSVPAMAAFCRERAQAHPGEIAGCVLINTSFGAFSPVQRRLRPRAWPALLEILLDRTAEGRERRVLGLTSARPGAHPQAVQDWTAIRRARPVRAGNAFRQLLAAARFRAPARAPAPALVLAGARDGLVDPRCSAEIARRWGCPLAVHPDAGHDLPLDDGAWVAREIRRWLAPESA